MSITVRSRGRSRRPLFAARSASKGVVRWPSASTTNVRNAQVAAATIVAELGEVSRFGAARQLMGYSGMVPKEHSSGPRIWRGGITKTGNAHLRRVVIEAAWAYRHRPVIGGPLRKRQEKLGEEVKEIAWKAQHRLHARYRRLTGRDKSKQQVVTAIGRELLGFIWAIGVQAESTMPVEGKGKQREKLGNREGGG